MAVTLIQERLFSDARSKQYSRKDVILSAGDRPPGIFLIEEGFVKVYSISDSGALRVHVFYGPGDVFPLIWAFDGQNPSVFYEAMNDVKLRWIPRDFFLMVTKKDQEVAFAVAELAAAAFRLYADRLENLEQGTAVQRVGYRLAALFDRFGKKQGEEIVLAAPFTHQDIADSLHMARETVSRIIEDLAKDGIIRSNNQMALLDRAKLEALLDR